MSARHSSDAKILSLSYSLRQGYDYDDNATCAGARTRRQEASGVDVSLHLDELLKLDALLGAEVVGSRRNERISYVEMPSDATALYLRDASGELVTTMQPVGDPSPAPPVILLANGLTVPQAYGAVMEELLSRSRMLANRSGAILQTLAEADLGGQDLQSVIALLSKLVGNSVTLKDSNYQVVAWHGDLADLDEPRQLAIESGVIPDPVKAMLDREGVLDRIRTERRPFRIEGHESLGLVPRVVCPVWSGDVHFGYLSISEGRRRLDAQDFNAAEYGATVVAFHLSRDRAVSESIRSQKALLIYELLFNPAKRSGSGRRQAAMLNLDLDQRFAVLIVVVQSPQDEAWDDDRWSRARTSMIATVDGYLARVGATSAVALAEQDDLLVITPGETAEVCGLAADLIRELRAYHRISVQAVGVSQTRTGSDGLKDSYEEARLAADLGRTIHGDGAITPYTSLGALRLLSEIPGLALGRHLSATLGDDQKFRQQFKVTYGALVEAGYNKAAAARQLYIHVNTLKYRLARIARITGHDPSDHNGRFALECTLRLLELEHARAHSAD